MDRPDLYLRRMVTNEHLSWRRRWHVRTVRPSSDEVLAAHAVPEHDHAQRVVEDDALWRRLADLPPRQRTVLVLRYYEADAVAASVEARLAARTADRTLPQVLTGRGARIAAAGLVTSTLAVAGAGAAAAANPYSSMARTFESLVQAVGIDWTVLGNGLTRDQYDAYWGAGYTLDDTIALESLWGLGTDETKARAGQMLLDGEALPLAPGEGGRPLYHDGLDAYWAAGYGYEEAVALAELWRVDTDEAKARASQVLEEGRTLPVPPPGEETPGTGTTGTDPTGPGPAVG